MLSHLKKTFSNESGVGMVSTMLALSLLAVFALVAASLAVNERRTSFNAMTHASALLSADSGGEAAIAFLMINERPPKIVNLETLLVKSQTPQQLDESPRQEFAFDLKMRGNPRPRAGYDTNFMDFFYDVDAEGEAGVRGHSDVGLIVSKLNKMNYN